MLKAGSGKSTLIKFIIEALELDKEKDVAYVSFTGKAAEVLRRNGCPNACTAHKLLYNAVMKEDGTFSFFPNEIGEIKYKVIVVDEISMLPKQMWDQLMKHKIYVIACGDPFQIPPVATGEDGGDNHILDNPHIFLDEIKRQDQNSEIIRLSMDIRMGKEIKPYEYGEVKVFNNCNIDIYNWADQIIVGTNNTRRAINNAIRQSAGRGDLPENGDKVISLANHWSIVDESKTNALVNGTIGYLDGIINNNQRYYINYGNFPKDPIPVTFGSLKGEYGNTYHKLVMDRKALISPDGAMTLTKQQEMMIMKNKYCMMRHQLPPLEFNYGYAITCHKAQGSQWNKIVVVEERFPFDKTEHARWLYTAVTRATERCVLILNK